MICTWSQSLHPCNSWQRNMLHMDPWNEIFIRNGPHTRPSIILEWFWMPTLQVLYWPQKADDMCGGPQMAPIKQIKYSGLPIGLSNSKRPSEMSVEKYPGNEPLLTHRSTNTQILRILRHLPLLPNYQHMYRESIPSTYHPTQTCIGSKNGHTILVSNF